MESTFVSLFSPGDTIISINGGKFGARWVEMPTALRLDVEEVKIPWGEVPSEDLIGQTLKKRPEAKGVYLTHCETSTGAATDIKRLSAVIRKHSDALVCVDGISAIGAMEMKFDEWGIDVYVGASQKGLMTPPGLSFVALSDRAITALSLAKSNRYYLDLKKALDSHKKNDTPWTPAISLVRGLDVSLELIRRETIEETWLRHSRIADNVRFAMRDIGLRLFSTSPSNSLTVVWLPDGVVWESLNSILQKKHGVVFAGGQGEFSGKILRMAHLGYVKESDISVGIEALRMALADLGFNLTI